MDTPSNSPAFDLNYALYRWRQALLAREAISPERAAELESHLGDTMVELCAKGLSDEEALAVAAHRLGDPDALSAAFAQAEPASLWRNRIFWMAIGFLLVPLAQVVAFTLHGLVLIVCARQGSDIFGIVLTWMLPLLLMAGTLFLLTGLAANRWPRLTRALDEFCSRRRRFAWQLLLLPLVPAVLGGLGFLLARQLLGDHPGQAFGAIMSGARIMDRSRLLFALWPVALALLAAAYAPPRFSSRHN